jgi:hypothetical protein
MRSIFRAFAFALVIALGGASSAFAATSATLNESFSVPATLSITLSVATINYGTLAKGATSAAFPENVTVTADAPWRVVATGTAFTSGANTVPSTARLVGGTPWADGEIMAGTGNDNSIFQYSLHVPSDVVPGSYTGHITYTISAT